MKKVILIVLLGLVMVLGISVNSYLFAVEIESTSVSVDVAQVFTMAFYPRSVDDPDANIRYANGQIDFPDITAAMIANPIDNAMVYTTNWVDSDLKSDVGILCISNTGADWKLGIHMTTSSPSLTWDNFVVYVPEFGYYRNIEGTELAAGGGGYLGGAEAKRWNRMPLDNPMRVFTGSGDYANTAPWGTLMTFGFAIVPSGSLTLSPLDEYFPNFQVCNGTPIDAGSHNVTIKYTMTPDL